MSLHLTCARLALASSAAIVLGACSVMHLQSPAITLTSVELTDVQIDQQQFMVQLHVQNPNDRPLPIKSVSCTLQVGGVDVGQGKSTGAFTVPANGDSDVDMVVTTNLASSVPNLLMRVVQRKDLPEYHLSGWVNPDIALLPPIPFSKSDRITIPQM
jgi:LEA14-like dessication related protein